MNTIDYNLALELKNAGYPIREATHWAIDDNGNKHPDNLCRDGVCLIIPTLSELIEACGDKFGGVVKCQNGKWATLIPNKSGSELSVTDVYIGTFDLIKVAVANHWLLLQNKGII